MMGEGLRKGSASDHNPKTRDRIRAPPKPKGRPLMKYQLELVTWVDATAESGWHMMPFPEKIPPLICKTAGFIVTETDTTIRIACSLGDIGGPHEQGSEIVTIPKVAIQSRQVLRKKT